MSVVVSGARGFIGSHLLPALAAAGFAGSAVSRKPLAAVPRRWTAAIRHDVLTNTALDCDHPDLIVHLEVKQHVLNPSAADLLEFQRVNVNGVAEWLAWASARDVKRFVYFSSIKAARPQSGPTDESAAPCGPDSPYGSSKAKAEQLVTAWVAANPNRCALILRPSVVYGPGNVGNVGAMVDAIARSRFFLVGPNTNIKSLVSVRNLVAATMFLMERMEPGASSVYNVVDHESYSVRQIDEIIRVALGKQGNSPTLPVWLANIAAGVGDTLVRVGRRGFPIDRQRLKALLETAHFSVEKLAATGFRHVQTTPAGIAEMVDWHRRPTRP